MNKNIQEIFEGNTRLLGLIDKAIIFFREGRYDLALEMIGRTGDGINVICDAIINNRDYFKLVSTDSVVEMLQGLLDAKLHKDYVLLADLYEMQLSTFITNVQELIIKNEDIMAFDDIIYEANLRAIEDAADRGIEVFKDTFDTDTTERLRVNRNALLEEPLAPEELLELGYGVEFTSSGLMTMRAPLPSHESIYLHTNGNITRENFLLARAWHDKNTQTYVIYGFGMGYHLSELRQLAPEAKIEVYESDINVLKLYAAFAEDSIITDTGLMLVYDPDSSLIEQRLLMLKPGEKACVHFPSFRRGTQSETLKGLVPWSKLVEEC